jgi:hypothetical protein
VCGDVEFLNVKVQIIEKRSGPQIKGIELTDALTEQDMINQIIRTVSGQIDDGIEISYLRKILTSCFGIAPCHTYDLVERIKIELNLYCPDQKHLYHVS